MLWRSLFGSGWFIAWHAAMWALWLLLVPVWLKMIAEDALKTPPATPSLGTFGVVMTIACYYALVTPVNAGLLAGALRWPWWGVALAVVVAFIAAGGGVLWLLCAMAETGGRAWVTAAVVACAALLLANLCMSGAAQGVWQSRGATPGAAHPIGAAVTLARAK